ncbi:hypothetical protein DFA_09280 [Cavenderia fasciculata]|uniref:Uncharacterized protein n=1 Tax=Cavenderia fasciculata TaxID=261658 RepID=F4Q768_CACFS|nr:uncharacterized protein DFA_09280 [Cavenderia fasciculata]EGG16250.1 hypothetical protein DFA_09280 [Cavenderia fasciculata]|eukprot:XP_004354634.1 hypothetical protein DFA_09280 [Cavenderia fasciculata]
MSGAPKTIQDEDTTETQSTASKIKDKVMLKPDHIAIHNHSKHPIFVVIRSDPNSRKAVKAGGKLETKGVGVDVQFAFTKPCVVGAKAITPGKLSTFFTSTSASFVNIFVASTTKMGEYDLIISKVTFDGQTINIQDRHIEYTDPQNNIVRLSLGSFDSILKDVTELTTYYHKEDFFKPLSPTSSI